MTDSFDEASSIDDEKSSTFNMNSQTSNFGEKIKESEAIGNELAFTMNKLRDEINNLKQENRILKTTNDDLEENIIKQNKMLKKMKKKASKNENLIETLEKEKSEMAIDKDYYINKFKSMQENEIETQNKYNIAQKKITILTSELEKSLKDEIFLRKLLKKHELEIIKLKSDLKEKDSCQSCVQSKQMKDALIHRIRFINEFLIDKQEFNLSNYYQKSESDISDEHLFSSIDNLKDLVVDMKKKNSKSNDDVKRLKKVVTFYKQLLPKENNSLNG